MTEGGKQVLLRIAEMSRGPAGGVKRKGADRSCGSKVVGDGQGETVLYLSCVLCSSCVFLGVLGFLGFPVSGESLEERRVASKGNAALRRLVSRACPECLGAVLPTGAAGESI